MHAISLYRYVSIAVVGGKLRFLSGKPRDLWHCIFRRSCCVLGANYCNRFYHCSCYGNWGDDFAHRVCPLAFSIVVR